MSSTALKPFPQIAEQLGSLINDRLPLAVQFGDGCPETLREAISYSLLAPGKRLRPILVLLAAEACGSDVEAALPAACAIEMVHAYSLVHDDLPAMDEDDLRRGRPTCHKQYDEATAILTGDALLTRAFELLVEEIPDTATAAACVRILSKAAGAVGMVGGQADDLDESLGQRLFEQYEHGEIEACLATIESIHRRKTGAMFTASLELGWTVAKADEAQASALRKFGESLGLAFQIIDDLLDVDGEEEATGKRLRKDLDQGKLTYPSLLGVKESRLRAEQLISEAIDAVASLAPQAERLEALARFVAERDR